MIVSFWVRGTGWYFQSLPYWYALAAVAPILLLSYNAQIIKIFQSSGESFFHHLFKLLPVYIIIAICLIKLSLIMPGDVLKLKLTRAPETEFSRIVKKITHKDEKILALSFQNYEYIVCERLPASSHFFYLPWQAFFKDKPKYAVIPTLVEDIQKNKPKIIFADQIKVWDINEFDWFVYAADVQAVLDRDYKKIDNKPFYIRNDIILSDYGIDLKTSK
jgi:hypothetical protein